MSALDDDPAGDGGAEQDAASVEERAANGEHLEPPEPPMGGDVQLSLNVGGVTSNRNARKVEEAAIVLQGGQRAVDALLDIDTEYELLVRVRPDAPKPVALRDPKTERTRAFKMVQTVQTRHVRRADTADAIYELFAGLMERDGEAAAALRERLAALKPSGLRAVS